MLKHFTALVMALLAGLMSVHAQAEDEEKPLLIGVKHLTTDTALRVAQAAFESCRKEGVLVAVTVSDRNGVPLVMIRESIAAHFTVEISHRKAYTAAMFKASTNDIGHYQNTGIAEAKDVMIYSGGEPIVAAGAIVGAVGVSGGGPKGPDVARNCALAGIEVIADDLEMMD